MKHHEEFEQNMRLIEHQQKRRDRYKMEAHARQYIGMILPGMIYEDTEGRFLIVAENASNYEIASVYDTNIYLIDDPDEEQFRRVYIKGLGHVVVDRGSTIPVSASFFETKQLLCYLDEWHLRFIMNSHEYDGDYLGTLDNPTSF